MMRVTWLLALGALVSGLCFEQVSAFAQPSPPQTSTHKGYAASVVRHIALKRFHPDQWRCKSTQQLARSGTVTVQFVMNRSGIVLDARILKSSGISDLDRAALITVRSASPIPLPPNDFGGERLHFALPIEYRSTCKFLNLDWRGRPQKP